MKKAAIIFLFAAILVSCKSTDKKVGGQSATLTEEEKQKALTDSTNFTSIEWLDPIVQDLGKLVKEQSIEISFRFKNSGSKVLLIESVSAQCGCTIPEKPEKPIAPGEEGVIKAKYNGSGHGTISKQIYVKANTSPAKDHTLTFTGEIQE
jgi:hypothetical protein